ncbi:MAG: YsnF/AvaK domain-containing protein, partial [Bryobacteraceae bacterium]
RGGVRVFSRMVETPVEEQVVLHEEHAKVERQAVNRPMSEAELSSLQNQSIEVRETAEETVVGKTSRIVEEVRIGKEATEHKKQIKDTVRRTQVEVDEITPGDVDPPSRRS